MQASSLFGLLCRESWRKSTGQNSLSIDLFRSSSYHCFRSGKGTIGTSNIEQINMKGLDNLGAAKDD